MTFRRGDVVLVPFPFSDLSTTKVRPAVVVSGALFSVPSRNGNTRSFALLLFAKYG